MNILTKYLLKKYLKYFLIFLLSMEIFFVGIDLIAVMPKLPNSANLQLLYVMYYTAYTLTITLPLSLVFAWVLTISYLIKHNELVSFYALHISPTYILRSVLLVSGIILLFLLSLQSTSLAYAEEQKNKILKKTYFVNEKSNIFLKYNEYFVYFKKLYPLEKKAEDVHIFKTKDNDIVETIVAEKASYQNNKWYIIDATITKIPQNINWNNSKLNVSTEKFLYTLEGFEPKIINNVYKAKVQYSTLDAIRAISLLGDQDLNTNKIKSILYSQLFIPFFVLPTLVLIFLFISPSSRFFRSAQFISISIFITLIIWGVLFLLQKLALGGIVLAEVGIILPLLILFFTTYYIFNKKIQ